MQPDQALLPTTMAVTDCACARSAPDTVAAELLTFGNRSPITPVQIETRQPHPTMKLFRTCPLLLLVLSVLLAEPAKDPSADPQAQSPPVEVPGTVARNRRSVQPVCELVHPAAEIYQCKPPQGGFRGVAGGASQWGSDH